MGAIDLTRLAALVLGAAFVWAGAAKIATGDRWTQNAREFGLGRLGSAVLPGIELLLGAALLVDLARRTVAVIVLALLAAFTVTIAHRLVTSDERPPCMCFGPGSDRPIGAGHLIRNAGLMVLAIAAVL